MNLQDALEYWDQFFSWVRGLPKPIALMVFGVIGGFVGAVVGEIYLLGSHFDHGPKVTHVNVKGENTSDHQRVDVVCLLLDTSASMSGDKLKEVAHAAKQFASTHTGQLALVRFSGSAQIVCESDQPKADIANALDQLSASGGTNMADGLKKAGQVLANTDGPSTVLLFTDGMPDDKQATIQAALQLGERGISIIAIATHDADAELLEAVTTDPDNVIPTTEGEYVVAFEQAEQLLSGQMIDPDNQNQWPFWFTLRRVAVWTMLIAMAAASLLVTGQNYLQRKPAPRFELLLRAIAGAAFAGGIAGVTGQLFFVVLELTPLATAISRISGWITLGGLLGVGMARFIPNVDGKRAAIAGAVGGLIGSILFMIVANLTGSFLGRLFGVLTLAASLGIALGMVELLYRRAWLVIRYGDNEYTTVNLGNKPVSVGGDHRDTIFVQGENTSALRFFFEGGKVFRVRGSERPHVVRPGTRFRVGTVELTVHAIDVAHGD